MGMGNTDQADAFRYGGGGSVTERRSRWDKKLFWQRTNVLHIVLDIVLVNAYCNYME